MNHFGSEVVTLAWAACEKDIILTHMLPPSQKENPLTFEKYYDTLKTQSDRGARGGYPHLILFDTQKFSNKFRYMILECLVNTVNSIVYGDSHQLHNLRHMQLFLAHEKLYKNKLDASQKTSFLKSALGYMELIKGLKSKEEYATKVARHFQNSIIFQYSKHFEKYENYASDVNWDVWILIDDHLAKSNGSLKTVSLCPQPWMFQTLSQNLSPLTLSMQSKSIPVISSQSDDSSDSSDIHSTETRKSPTAPVQMDIGSRKRTLNDCESLVSPIVNPPIISLPKQNHMIDPSII
jgi:hypothetical protein